MTQLSLLDWAEMQRRRTSGGGRCHSCLEYDNWIVIERELNQHKTESTVTYECDTVVEWDYDTHAKCGYKIERTYVI